ncbi:COG3400 family protein [Nitrosophilus kaiyonis]|uniref:COG3400 family protein n=1 Tax=Nitrosophilus kaiyonis TaxID=2930200 RepID=UPI002491CF7F|nr:TrkA C-terminal domain-containing protein [Nitrosophilus kaiyonis]
MKNILILADGIVAKHFLERVVQNYVTDNEYFVVYYDEKILPEIKTENFRFFKFDPTSFVKLSLLFDEKFSQVMIVMGNKIDTIASYENIRRLDLNISIVIYDKWDLDINDQNVILLNANEILSNRLMDYLPNVPIIAQNVGLGLGEIMEVLVPFGSTYVYRHIGSIEQKNWKIAAIYRNNRLILPDPKIMIWPNDLLLIIGEPKVLKNIYKSIKREIGQFPIPYGTNIYLFINMETQKNSEIEKSLHDALWLHKILKDKKLIIRVINPTSVKLLDKIKSKESKSVEIRIDYTLNNDENVIQRDINNYKIGLITLYNTLFENRKIRKLLYNLKIPVFTFSSSSIENLKESAILLTKNKDLEQISSTIFDISVQLQLDLVLYDVDPESEDKSDIIEHYENLASIFSKKIKIVKSKNNPIRELLKEENLLEFLPFNKKMLKSNLLRIFSTDPEALYFKLKKFHQIFIPIG